MIKSNIFYQIAPSFLNSILNIITFLLIAIFMSSKIGISFYGELATSLSFIGILYIFGDFGINHLFPKIVSRDRNIINKLSTYVSFLIILRLIWSIILSMLLFLFYAESVLLASALSIYLVSRLLNPEMIFKALENNLYILSVNFLSKIFILLMFINYDFTNKLLEESILIIALGNLFYCLALFYKLFKSHQVYLTFSKDNFHLFQDSFNFFYPRLIFNLQYHGSTFFVSLILPFELVGIYALAIEFFKAGQVLIGSVSTAYYVRTSFNRNFQNLITTTKYFLLVQLIFLPIFILYGNDLLQFFFTFDASILFQILLIFYFFSPIVLVNSFWGYPFFSSIDKEGIINKITIFSSISYFLFFALLQLFNLMNIHTAILCIIIADIFGFIPRIYFIFTNRFFLFNTND